MSVTTLTLYIWGEELKNDNSALEFEQSRLNVLKMAREAEDKRKAEASILRDTSNSRETSSLSDPSRKYAWEYEILEYRKRRKSERFAFIGGACGIVSLILTVVLNWHALIALFNWQ